MKLLIPRAATKQHIGFIGTIGAGKTQGMMQLYDAIDDQKKIVIDIKGDYTSTYKKDGDLILCPFDARSIGWNIFNDIENYQDVQNIAASLVPETPGAKVPYYDNAARNIVEAVMLYLVKNKSKPTNADLWEYLTDIMALTSILSDIECKRLVDAYMDTSNQKSIRELMGTIVAKREIRALEALADIDGDFSLKAWVRNDERKETIFLLASDNIVNSVLPLYRVIVELAASELLSLPDDSGREIYFFLDELPKLRRMQKVIDLMTLARSKGGRVIYSIQTVAQLQEAYGKEGATTMLDTTNTYFIYRTSDAKPLEEYLGSQEVWEYSEGTSFGANEISDRIMASKQKKEKALVLASEIQRLENLQCYVKSIGADITKVHLSYKSRPLKNEMFVSKIKEIRKPQSDSFLMNETQEF